MHPFRVVKGYIVSYSCSQSRDCPKLEVNQFIFNCQPEAFLYDVVKVAVFAIHAYCNLHLVKFTGKFFTGILRAWTWTVRSDITGF